MKIYNPPTTYRYSHSSGKIKNMTLVKLIYDDLLKISGLKKKKPERTLHEQIKALFTATKRSLNRKTKTQLSGIILEVEEINKRLSERVSVDDKPKIDSLKKELDELIIRNEENQKVIDGFIKSKEANENL